MKTVFVTGVNGLLGTNLTHLLLSRGYFVKGLVRDKSRYEGNRNANLQLIEGDLFDDFTKVLSDVDYVVHIAAITCQNVLEYTDYWKVNESATIQLFHAAAKCNIKRFVFVSTANTLGHGSMDRPGNENDPVREPFSKSLYAKSKKEAEAQMLNNKQMMETIIVNPTFMLGGFDSKPSSGKIILMGWRKKVIFYPPGGKNFVHVEDVADGIIRCIENGRNGEKYILANENLSYKDFFTKLNSISSQKPAMIKIPRIILLGIGIIGDLLRGLRIKTSLSLVNMKILCTNNFYTNKKSITELGVNYQPVDLAIIEALNYFKNNGIEKRSN
jgi:dihydroflavonol-4-reductase